MNSSSRLIRAYLECAAFVVLWMLIEVYARLSPLHGQWLGLLLIPAFQLAVARRPLRELWAFDAPRFKVNWQVAAVVLVLAGGCVMMLWPGRGRPAPGLGDRVGLGIVAVIGCVPAAFALFEQRWAGLRRVGWLVGAAMLFCVAWRALWHGVNWGLLIPAEKRFDFATLWLCEFVALFLFDEVCFRGALDPHLARAGSGRLHAICSAVFVSILWAMWHLPAYNPHIKTFFALFHTIAPIAFAQVGLGVMFSYCARGSRTLVPSALVHAFANAYVLSLM